MQTRRLNAQRQYITARRSSLFALLCNILAVLEYIFILVVVTALLIIYFLGDLESLISYA